MIEIVRILVGFVVFFFGLMSGGIVVSFVESRIKKIRFVDTKIDSLLGRVAGYAVFTIGLIVVSYIIGSAVVK